RAVAPLVQWSKSTTMEEFLQKHYKELSPVDKQVVLTRLERGEGGLWRRCHDHRHQGAGGREVWLRAESFGLQRLPQMRGGMPSREQSRSELAQFLHPRFRDAARHDGHGKRQRELRASGAATGQVLHAGAVPAMRASAVRGRVSGRGYVEGTGRNCRG